MNERQYLCIHFSISFDRTTETLNSLKPSNSLGVADARYTTWLFSWIVPFFRYEKREITQFANRTHQFCRERKITILPILRDKGLFGQKFSFRQNRRVPFADSLANPTGHLSQCPKFSPLVKLGLTTEQKYIACKVAQMKELDMAFLGVKPMVIERDILNISLARKVDGRRMTRVQSRHINFAWDFFTSS